MIDDRSLKVRWESKLRTLLAAGRGPQLDAGSVHEKVIHLEYALMKANFGFMTCQDGSRQKTPFSKKCMERQIADTVEKHDSESIHLKEVVFSSNNFISKPEHVVYRATFWDREQQQVAVHAYHFCNTPPGDDDCPHHLVRTKIGALSCDAVVPVCGYVWGEGSRVLWVIEPLCELPDHTLMDTPGFQRSQIDLMKKYLPTVAVVQELKVDQALLHHGDIRYRQRYFKGPSPMLVNMRYSSIFAETFTEVYKLWDGYSQDRFCFQKSDENFRQLCVTADKEVMDKVIELMHNWTGASKAVRWEAFYRSVQLFGYWWMTRDLEGLKRTLSSFFLNRDEMFSQLKNIGDVGFRGSSTTSYLVASVKNGERSIPQMLVVFDADTGMFYAHECPQPLFPSPFACIAHYHSNLPHINAVPSTRTPTTDPYRNKDKTSSYANK